MMRDAQRLERDQAGDVRFVSLVHLYNSCATPKEMTAYVAALNKLMNSLSWGREPAKLTPLDAAGTVLSFRLADFGWTQERWKLIEDAYPPALAHSVAPDVSKVSGSKAVIVNGDWLAAAAGETPLYYQLLGIPPKLSEFAAINGTNIEADIRAGSVRRIAVSASTVTRGNRLIERHPGSRAGLWLVYDFATSTGEQNIFQRPLAFKPDEIRALLELPNGFYAFALFDANGNRIDRVLPGIEKPYAGVQANAVEPTTKAGNNCLACHTRGLVEAKDDFRGAGPVDIGSTPMLADRRAALPLFGTDSENALLMLGGTDRYRSALSGGS
jgi:mono/diheme cytochrome c family protein